MARVIAVDPQVFTQRDAVDRRQIGVSAQHQEDHRVLADEAIPHLIRRQVIGTGEAVGGAVAALGFAGLAGRQPFMSGDDDRQAGMGVHDALRPVQHAGGRVHLQRQIQIPLPVADEGLPAVQPVGGRAAIPVPADEMRRRRPEIEAPGATAGQGPRCARSARLGPPGIVVVVVIARRHPERNAAAAQD